MCCSVWMQQNHNHSSPFSNAYQPVLTGHARYAPFCCITDTHDPQRARQSPPQSRRERAIRHTPSIAITIQEYLGAPHNARHFIIITDASPWRLCAALYDPPSNKLLIWTTYRLPYVRDIRAQFQVQLEYLGHLLATILVAHYGQLSILRVDKRQYRRTEMS